jgi:hypothetical protein
MGGQHRKKKYQTKNDVCLNCHTGTGLFWFRTYGQTQIENQTMQCVADVLQTDVNRIGNKILTEYRPPHNKSLYIYIYIYISCRYNI